MAFSKEEEGRPVAQCVEPLRVGVLILDGPVHMRSV